MQERTQIASGPRGGLHGAQARIGAALVGLFAAGCAGGRPASHASTEPGTTTILVENHVGAPAALDRLLVSIDGADVALSAVPPPEESPTAVALLRLLPGQHTIAVRATARDASQGIVVVASQQIFHLTDGPAAINVNVRSRDATSNDAAEQRLAVDLRMRGGELSLELGMAPPEDKDSRCGMLRPIPRALCRAAADLGQATQSNDTMSALCVQDKLTEMRRLAQIADAGPIETASLAEKQVLSLSRDVDRCIGDVVLIGADGVTVKRGKAPPRAAQR